jgi:hypothetical protein
LKLKCAPLLVVLVGVQEPRRPFLPPGQAPPRCAGEEIYRGTFV